VTIKNVVNLMPVFVDKLWSNRTVRFFFFWGGSNKFELPIALAALAIDKVGPYHFRSGPTSGPTTRPGSQKSTFCEWSIALLSWKVILSVWNAGKPFGGWAYSDPPDTLAGGEGDGCPLLTNPTPALGPSGLQPWPFGPHSLPLQIRLPKSAYVVNLF